MDSIADGGSYIVRIRNGPEVDNACAPNANGDDLSANVVLTLQCSAPPSPTVTPTDPPTRVEATVIKGTWNDDYRLDGKGLLGWAVRRDNVPISDTVFQGTRNRYHGAFIGTNYMATTSNDYHLTRYFYCSKASSVSIRYKYVYCGTESTDHCWLYLNNKLVDQSNGRPLGRLEWTDSLLRERFTKCTRNDWTYNELGPFYIESVASELFKVEINLGMNYGNDMMAITDLTVTCQPLDSAFTSNNNIMDRQRSKGEAQDDMSPKDVHLHVDTKTKWNLVAMVLVLAINVVCIWYYVESKSGRPCTLCRAGWGREYVPDEPDQDL